MSRQAKIVSPTGSPFAVAVMFFGNGLVMASSFSRMPGIRDQVGAIPTQLAFALVCVGIGSIVGMPFTGRLVDRYSSQTVSRVATAICLGGWAMLPLAASVPVPALVLLIAGLGTGVGDVAMNVQGHLIEQRRCKVLMPYWHGLFCFGAVAGALAASLGLPLALAWQLPGVSVVLMVAMWFAAARYIPDAGLHPTGSQEQLDQPIFDDHRLRRLSVWGSADRFSSPHDAPRPGAVGGSSSGTTRSDPRSGRPRARPGAGERVGRTLAFVFERRSLIVFAQNTFPYGSINNVGCPFIVNPFFSESSPGDCKGGSVWL